MIKTSSFVKQYLAEITYGGNDGIVTTFAVVSGFSGASILNGSSIDLAIGLVVLFGLANLFADGLSMGIGNYLSRKAESEISSDVADYSDIYKTSIVTFLSFILFGSLPLVPYIFGVETVNVAFAFSIITTIVALSLLGFLKGFVMKKNYIRSILETLFIGGIAAVVAFLVGALLKV